MEYDVSVNYTKIFVGTKEELILFLAFNIDNLFAAIAGPKEITIKPVKPKKEVKKDGDDPGDEGSGQLSAESPPFDGI